MDKRTLIVDTDPGIDDAIAFLILAKYKDNFDIKLFTTTAGNCSIDITTKNTQFFAEKYFNGVRVAKGASDPLVRVQPRDASDVHSAGGLGNFQIPEKINYPVEENSVEAMADVLRSAKDKVTLVTLGAMTNVARLLINYPELRCKIDKIYAMIGSIEGKGNIEPYAEFNAYFDPEALDIVAKAGIPMVVNPMELGVASVIKKSRFVEQTSQNDTHDMIKTMVCGVKESIGTSDDVCLYDPNTIVALIRPDLYEFVPCDIEIYTNSEVRGKCVMTKNNKGIHAYQIMKDPEAINKFVLDALFN